MIFRWIFHACDDRRSFSKNHSWVARAWFIGKFMADFFGIPQYITPEQRSKPLRHYDITCNTDWFMTGSLFRGKPILINL